MLFLENRSLCCSPLLNVGSFKTRLTVDREVLFTIFAENSANGCRLFNFSLSYYLALNSFIAEWRSAHDVHSRECHFFSAETKNWLLSFEADYS